MTISPPDIIPLAPEWTRVALGDPEVKTCAECFHNVAPKSFPAVDHGGTDALNGRLIRQDKDLKLRMIEVWLHADGYCIALDLSLKRPRPNDASTPRTRQDWHISVGIHASCTQTADTIYASLKKFIAYQLTFEDKPFHKYRSLFVVWDKNGTVVPGRSKIDDVTNKLLLDANVLKHPFVSSPADLASVGSESAYGHYTKDIRRVQITQITL